MSAPSPPAASDRVLTLPNLISFARIVLVFVFAWLVLVADEIAVAGWLLAVIGSTDWVDGYLARRLGQVTEIGKLLDPVADRLAMVTAVLAGLVAGVLPVWFGWALIIREALIAGGALVVGVRAGRKVAVRTLGKAATLLLYASVAWFYIGVGTPFRPLEVAAWVAGVPGLVLYYVVGVQYFADALAVVRGSPSSESASSP